MPTLDGGTLDGFTLDILSSASNVVAGGLGLTDVTLGSAMLLEDTGSNNGVLDAAIQPTLDITGTVTNNGTLRLDGNVNGDTAIGLVLSLTTPTATFVNNGTLSVGVNDGLADNGLTATNNGLATPYGTLVNNGVIDYGSQVGVSGGHLNDMAFHTTITGTGTIIVNNTSLQIGASIGLGETIEFVDSTSAIGVTGRLGGATAGFEGTIEGFRAGDLLIYPGFAALQTNPSIGGPSIEYDPATHFLTINTVLGKDTFYLAGSINYTNLSFYSQPFTNPLGNVTFAIGTTAAPCFAAGTRIATERGEVPVEALAVGDRVLTARRTGAPGRPVRWIGHRQVDVRAHPDPESVRPVRVRAGAFGPGRPARDLRLSPDHAVFAHGVLIPVRYLVNGATIAPVAVAEVRYFHVELDAHDIVLAEGLPAESYLDTGNRAAFANGGTVADLRPDFARRVWDAEGCAPLVLGGPHLARARRRLLARARRMGHALTGECGVALWHGGTVLPATWDGRVLRVALGHGAGPVVLASRVWVPAWTTPEETDTRTLGVAVSRLWLDGRQASLDSPGLGAGWHPAEARWRWTDGAAEIAVAGARELAIEIAMSGTYWRDGAALVRAA